MERIESAQNHRIKQLQRLHKAHERRESGLFIIEGAREIQLALNKGYQADTFYYCPELDKQSAFSDIKKSMGQINCIEINSSVFSKVTYRDQSDGLLAVFCMQSHSLEYIKLSACPFIIILEAIEKPGNLGAILRTADAANVDAVIICDPKTDFYNPNVIRSSIGCVFTNQVAATTNENVFDWLRKNKLSIFAAALSPSAVPYHTIDFSKPTALVMGTEATGLSDFWLKNSKAQIIIPMQGSIDSLNVATATAVLTFEAARQRGFAKHQ